jgi:hypothetical protein
MFPPTRLSGWTSPNAALRSSSKSVVTLLFANISFSERSVRR